MEVTALMHIRFLSSLARCADSFEGDDEEAIEMGLGPGPGSLHHEDELGSETVPLSGLFNLLLPDFCLLVGLFFLFCTVSRRKVVRAMNSSEREMSPFSLLLHIRQIEDL